VTLTALRERAITLQRAGRIAEAEQIYAQVLRGDPTDVVALGCSAVALRDLGRPAEALARASAAIALKPTTDAWCTRGAALGDLGRFPEAVASFDQALALTPQCVEAHNYRGMALQGLQQPAEALASFERALSLRPDSAELHNNRGNTLRHLQRFPEALASFERAIALQPSLAPAYNNRGLVLQALGRYAEAARSYRRALALQPQFAEAYNNLGTVQCELGQPAEALVSCRRALELQPGMPGIHANLGNALRDLERPEEALAQYDLALQQAPQDADNHCHRGNALHDMQLLPQAIACYERAIELNPQHARAHFNKGLCLLLSGDFARGLPLYEWRKELAAPATRAMAAPAWRGEAEISGRTLLLHADQALGDTIQFCRYARLAEQRGAHVVLAVQPQLRELMRGLSSTMRIVAAGEAASGCDYQCALTSLPLAFRTTLADIPAAVPYLCADEARVAQWRERIGAHGFKIGIIWHGSRNRIDVGRSVPLEMFARLAGIAGVRLISLQKDDSRLPSGLQDLPLEMLAEPFDTGPQAFLDSAAVIAHLDLVITCDTALAHLAGALGRPTWVALKHVPDWRWLLDRANSPWYPSLRLFRQSRRGDWDGVFAAMHEELMRLTACSGSPAR
jgi:tetratricopeptide (TPR) repeat protein